MDINQALISKLEQLARLELSAEEKESLRQDLNNILHLVEKLQEVDTEGVAPLVYLNEEQNTWRADEVTGQVSREAALRNAPDADGTFFRVPKVIDLK